MIRKGEEVHREKIEQALFSNPEYRKQVQYCVDIFNCLKMSLEKEECAMLLDYDEALAYRENLIMHILAEKALA